MPLHERAVVGAQTFDETAAAELLNATRFVKGENGRLVFKKLPHAPRVPIFQGFQPGEVVFEPSCFEADGAVPPEWWGASGNADPACAHANVLAINAALAAVAKTRLAVALSGTYCIDGVVLPQSGSALKGPGGVKAVANMPVPPQSCLVAVFGQSDVVIEGIEVDGNRLNQTQDAAHTYGGICLRDASRCVVRKCNVHDGNGPLMGGACGNGIRTHCAADIVIADNQIHDNNGCGINLYFSSKRIEVSSNTIRNNTEIGIESEGRNGTNYAEFRNEAIAICRNDITGSTEPSRIDDHSVLVDWTDRSMIASNRCQRSHHNGIEMLGCKEIAVKGNVCENIGDSHPDYTWAAFRVTAEGYGENGRSADITICDNTATRCQNGVLIDTADRVTVGRNAVVEPAHLPPVRVGAGVTGLNLLDGAETKR